jgi:hypothetical protein
MQKMKSFLRKKSLLLVCIAVSICGNITAQTNLLEQIQVPKINIGNWIEKDNYYYFLSMQHAGPGNDAMNGRKALQYVLNKYDKNTLQRIDWKVIAGDTLQNDTLISIGLQMFLQKDTFYLLYYKDWDIGEIDPETGYYIKKLDTDFNTILSERRYDIDYPSLTGALLGCAGPLPDGNVFIGQITNNSPYTSETLILNHNGDVIQQQFPGIQGDCGGNGQVSLRSFVPLDNQTYIISGRELCGHSCNGEPLVNDFAFQLLDSNMHLLDTFYYKRGMVTSDTPMHIHTMIFPTTIALPGGSLICSGGMNLDQAAPSLIPNFPLITKLTKASRYGVDKYIAFGPVNNTDSAHGIFSTPFSTVYNPHDNNLYFADLTHYGSYGVWGSPVKNESFIEIISLDTNLNFRWRKFIKLTGNYHWLGINTSSDNRNGVIVGGYSNFAEAFDPNYDSAKMWVYHVDDNTPSANPTVGISAISVHENGFSFYPNPASDVLHIASEKSTLRSIVICDISGRTLLTKSLSKQEESIDIGLFGKGMYLLKCEDKDGQVFVGKVMKE